MHRQVKSKLCRVVSNNDGGVWLVVLVGIVSDPCRPNLELQEILVKYTGNGAAPCNAKLPSSLLAVDKIHGLYLWGHSQQPTDPKDRTTFRVDCYSWLLAVAP